MIYDVEELDLIKGITRAEAKAVHNDLPPGGVWRTIRGHHVYIKDGKVVAGSIPGVTKAKKATKAQLKEHQAHIDKEAKKTAPKKKATASKGAKTSDKKTTTKSKKTTTKSKKATTGKSRSTQSKSTSKRATSTATSKPSGTKSGTKTTTGAKTKAKSTASKAPAKSTKSPAQSTGEKELRQIASKAEDGMDMFSMVSPDENPKAYAHLRELMAQRTGKSVEKLNAIHKELGGGTDAESPQVSSKAYDDFTPGRAKHAPSKVAVGERTDGRTNMASAPTGASIQVNKKDLASHDDLTQKGVIAHEVGHILSNAYPGLASHILDNPQGALGELDTKNRRFKGVGGTLTPEESWAESYSAYNTDPKWLKDKHPKAYDFVEAVLKKIPKHQEYLDNAMKQTNELLGKKPKGAGTSATKKPATKTKASTKKSSTSGAGKSVGRTKKATSKGNAKDIRTEAQKNRELAYDVGDKVGGARKDEYEARFREKPTLQGLANLEKESGAIAEKLVTKANLLPKFDPVAEHKNGVDLETALAKKLIFDRIAPKPIEKTPEARREYMQSLQKLHRQLAGIKTWDNMRNAIRELSDIGTKGLRGQNAQNKLDQWRNNPGMYSYLNEELYKKQLEEGRQAKAMMDFDPLGEKLRSFFTNWDSRENSFRTIRKNARGGWDKYLNPEAKAPKKKAERGAENKKWERKAEDKDLRTGGKKVKVDKPEDLMKQFGVRGVEFGHWVNDSSGKYHLQRSAEAFSDLANVLGIDDKDISLNGRLAIAFGARGKGGALAHYEPDRKVINMTKYGGAGSLAHEWGHAMDNILYQYSHGGKESLGLASEEPMGSADPKLNMLYDHLIDTIRKPLPGEKGAVKKIEVDSSKPENRQSHYYPHIRRKFQEAGAKEGYDFAVSEMQRLMKQQQDIIDQYEPLEKKANSTPGSANSPAVKRIKRTLNGARRDLKKLENSMPHIIAKEMELATGKPYKGTIEIPTGNSEYYQRMLETTSGKGANYWGSNAEMFARVFESYIEDKLKQNKQYNNYLVHGTTESHVKAMGAPFPLGKERKAMFKAMENLITHVTKGQTLKKALVLEELRKSLGYTERSAYVVPDASEVIYIPINRLRTPYQTEQATDFDKVHENFERMKRGEALEPVVIGYDYDLHDGHHRVEASRKMDFTHVPCVVMKGTNDIERQRAIEAYNEVWKSHFHNVHHLVNHHAIEERKEHAKLFDEEELREVARQKLGKEAFEEDERYIYRGIGLKELKFIAKNGYIESKGKGNDADKNNSYTCFSTLYSQAVGYARSNYDLYNEKQAFVIALPKPEELNVVDGEIVMKGRIQADSMIVIPIPREIR